MLIEDCLGYIDKSISDLQGKELTSKMFVNQFIDLIALNHNSQVPDCMQLKMSNVWIRRRS